MVASCVQPISVGRIVLAAGEFPRRRGISNVLVTSRSLPAMAEDRQVGTVKLRPTGIAKLSHASLPADWNDLDT